MDSIEKIKRVIQYYEITFDFKDEFSPGDGDKHGAVFNTVITLARTRADIRYQDYNEKSIFMQGLSVNENDKTITGKLRCIRKDLLPEIMNTKTDESRDLDAKEEEGLVETTHFIIDYSKPTMKLAIEHNQFGAKIGNFVDYLQRIGNYKGMLRGVGFAPVVKDELSELQARINRCSEFVVKVHKNNIEKIKSMDEKIYSSLKACIEHYDSDYATLILKFDYKQKAATAEINNSVLNLINGFRKDKRKTNLFNTLSIKAEDSEKNDLLENFDLLINKVKSEIMVQKKKRYRTIISDDIFSQMRFEILRKRI